MKTKIVFLGILLLATGLALRAGAYTIEELVNEIRPGYFQQNPWPVIMSIMTSTTTTTTLPVFHLNNRTVEYNASWCLNLTQTGVGEYAFQYDGWKISLNDTLVQVILDADRLAGNCTRLTRVRVDVDFIPICNNSNPSHIWGVNCKYGSARCISYGARCGSMTHDEYWNGCERVD